MAAVVDGHRSSFKSINSGVPQGSVLSPTLFLLLIIDLLSITPSPIHSFAKTPSFIILFSLKAPPPLTTEVNGRNEGSLGAADF